MYGNFVEVASFVLLHLSILVPANLMVIVYFKLLRLNNKMKINHDKTFSVLNQDPDLSLNQVL